MTSFAHFHWQSVAVPFLPGETIASAMLRAGLRDFGFAGSVLSGRVFCGIGACQACLVGEPGKAPVEACITLARPGARFEPVFHRSPAGETAGAEHG